MTATTDLQTYHKRLEASCPMGDVRKWRTLKGLLYALLILGSQFANGYFGLNSELSFVVAAVVVLVIFGAEFKEIQIANWVTLTFKNGNDEK